ncbi:hypothetical protein D3C71_1958030 [compost metagenome]
MCQLFFGFQQDILNGLGQFQLRHRNFGQSELFHGKSSTFYILRSWFKALLFYSTDRQALNEVTLEERVCENNRSSRKHDHRHP